MKLFLDEANYFLNSLDQPGSAHDSIFSSSSSDTEDASIDEIDETEIVANSILKQHNTFDKYDEENHSQLEVDHGFTEE